MNTKSTEVLQDNPEPLKSRTITISLKQDITPYIEQYGKYAWILHDKDKDLETGEGIDPHYHIYLEFPNARSLNSVASELGIIPSLIQIVRNKKGILNYLIHANQPQKHQYDMSEVHTNFDLQLFVAGVDMASIYKLCDSSTTFQDFITELSRRGLNGNPLSNLCNCLKLWDHVKGLHDSFFDRGKLMDDLEDLYNDAQR